MRMSAAETSEGSNIPQKGYSFQGKQYKLQVDGMAGKPSFVFVGSSGPIWHAQSRASISDSTWHNIECLRDGELASAFISIG